MSNDLDNKILKIVSKKLRVELEKVTPEKSLIDDLGADSLDVIEVIMALEYDFGILIVDEEVEKTKTVKQILELTKQKIEHT